MIRFSVPLAPPAATLAALVARGLAAAAPGRPTPAEAELARVVRQGSVWLGRFRVKDPALSLGELRRLARSAAPRGREAAVETIEVFWPEKPIAEYTMDPSQVVYADRHLLVAYKPAGVNTCQSVFSDTNCLTWGVQKWLDAEGGFPSDPLDTEAELPGRYVVRTINRLDYATRGLVFYARGKEAEKALHRMFMDRRVHKRYLVGTAAPAAGSRLAALDPAPGYNLVIRDPVEWQGKVQEACTLVRLLERSGPVWWWAALPQTGRTHQIRKHFAARLAPIAGDLAYGGGRLAGEAPAAAAEPDEANEADGPADPDSLLLACVAYRCRHPVTGELLKISYLPPGYGPGAPLP